MIQILQGHCLERLKELPDESVQCVVTSPPYWGLRDYGIEPVGWPTVSFTPMPGLGLVTVPGETSVHGLERELTAFVAHEVAIFREVRRVLRSDGVCWVNLGDGYARNGGTSGGGNRELLHMESAQKRMTKIPEGTDLKVKDIIGIPWRVAFALQADGWYLRQDIIWHKPNPMPESIRDRCTKAHEYLFLLSKSERYYWDQDAILEPANGNAHRRIPAGCGVGDEPRSAIELQKNGVHRKTRAPGVNPKAAPAGSGIKNNESFSASVSDLVSSRNPRSVWSMQSEAFPDAHFATFPTALPRRCIMASTSARGCCPSCGAPWERVVEIQGETPRERAYKVGFAPKAKRSSHYAPQGLDFAGSHGGLPSRTRQTVSWKQSCQCPENQPVPCTVLDPFGGSGTTGQVAIELGRKAILIEANAEYVNLIRQRTSTTIGLPLS